MGTVQGFGMHMALISQHLTCQHHHHRKLLPLHLHTAARKMLNYYLTPHSKSTPTYLLHIRPHHLIHHNTPATLPPCHLAVNMPCALHTSILNPSHPKHLKCLVVLKSMLSVNHFCKRWMLHHSSLPVSLGPIPLQ